MNGLMQPGSSSANVRRIKRSAARGAVFVATRQVVVQGVNVLGTVLLMRTLTISEFGLYAVLILVSQVTALFSGTALALQAVRSPTPLPKLALRVLFTAQVVLASVGFLSLWLLAPEIAAAYHVGVNVVFALRIISLAMLISCFQTIPVALLERDLQFGRLAVAEISRAVAFNCVAVGLAWAGYGIEGIAFGILSRVLVGTVIVNFMKKWPLGLALDRLTLQREIGSGIAYFGTAVVSVLKDAMNPVFLGLLLGAADVGLVNWANTVSSYCVIALMMLQRLYIPIFSRMANHPDELSGFVLSVLKITNAIAAPAACLMLAMIHPLTVTVFGSKWLDAVPVFYLFWMGNLIVPTVTPLVSLLQALDRGSVAFLASLMWMLLTWVIGVPAILWFGVIGAGVANLLVQFSNYFILRIVRRHVQLKLLVCILPFWAIAGVISIMIWVLTKFRPPTTALETLSYVLAGCAAYLVGVYFAHKKDFHAAIRLVRQGMLTMEAL